MSLHRRIFLFFRFSNMLLYTILFSSFSLSLETCTILLCVCFFFSLSLFFLTLVLLFYMCVWVFIWLSITKENSFTIMSFAFYTQAHALHFFVLQFFSLIFLYLSLSLSIFFAGLSLSLLSTYTLQQQQEKKIMNEKMCFFLSVANERHLST